MTIFDLVQKFITAVEGGEADFAHANRVHDWRNHVPADIKALWDDLTTEARAAVWLCAEEAASREEWE